MDGNNCRLCGGVTELRFTEDVLGKYPTGFWRCGACMSLQTDLPHWLSESYANIHSATDTGMVARNLHSAEQVGLLLRIAGVGPTTACLDWGGGNGLFCRLMRDQGYDFRNYDKYAEPFYCAGFTIGEADQRRYDVVTSFEVFEHLSNPQTDLTKILHFQPRIWLFSTQLYQGQGPEWPYLSLANGRHVFFYSAKALERFAALNGYQFVRGRHIHVFLKLHDNPYLQGRIDQMLMRRIMAGGVLAGAASGLHFLSRQRLAYRYWQADSAALRRGRSAQEAQGDTLRPVPSAPDNH